MRRCEHCGRQYKDKVLICPVDAQPTVNPHEKPAAAGGSSLSPVTFNAQIVSPISATGSYRVYARGGDLLFIQVDSGGHSALNALAPILGAAGGAITMLYLLFSQRSAKDYRQRLETDDPENLLRNNPKNFRLHLAEIREAVLELPPRVLLTGKAVGGATLLLRQSEKLKLALPAREDVEAVSNLLAPTLRAALRVTVEWNASAQQYQKVAPQILDRKNELA